MGLQYVLPRTKAVEPIIAQAMKQGIPVVTFGTDSPNSKRLTYIGTDQPTAARHAAQVLAKLINNKGEIIISQGLPTYLTNNSVLIFLKKK